MCKISLNHNFFFIYTKFFPAESKFVYEKHCIVTKYPITDGSESPRRIFRTTFRPSFTRLSVIALGQFFHNTPSHHASSTDRIRMRMPWSRSLAAIPCSHAHYALLAADTHGRVRGAAGGCTHAFCSPGVSPPRP